MINVYDFFDEINKRKVNIRLDAGQPDIPPNQEIIKALISSLGYMGYGSSRGLDELRSRIAEIYGVSTEEVAVTPGSKFAITAILQNSKKVSLIAPYWPAYAQIARSFGKMIDVIETRIEDGWLPNYWNPSGDTIIINYPNNPTGIIPNKDFTKRLVEEANRKSAMIVSDEVYRDISFDNRKFTILDYESSKFAMVYSFSKTFSAPGLRLGYVVSDKETIKGIVNFVQTTITSVPLYVQKAGLRALDLIDHESNRVANIYGKRIRLFSDLLDKSLFEFSKPDGGMYLFLKLGNINGTEFSYELLQNGIGVFPGEAFGASYMNYIRISLTSSEELLQKAAKKMNEVARQWKQ